MRATARARGARTGAPRSRSSRSPTSTSSRLLRPGTRRCRPACPIRACRRRRPHRRRRRRRQSATCRRVFTEQQIFAVQAAHGRALRAPPRPHRAARSAVCDRVAMTRLGIGAVRAWRQRFDSNYAALLLSVARGRAIRCAVAGALTRDIPPCGHVAGSIARTDLRDRRAQGAGQRRARLGAGRHGRGRSTTRPRRAQSTRTSTRSARSRDAGCASSARAPCRAIPTGASSTCAAC